MAAVTLRAAWPENTGVTDMPQQPPTPRSWRLEDAEAVARAHPYTFYKPSAERVAQLKPGNLAKVIFAFDTDDPRAPSAERMWLVIESVLDDRFVGRLDNDPIYIADLNPGDRVEFEARHIIDTDLPGKEDSPVERYGKRCFVSNRVLYDGAKVGYLYREEPVHNDDSGWRITAGTEPEDYMDNADNVSYVSLGAVLNLDDRIVGLLDSPPGSEFGVDPAGGRFVPIED